MSSELGLKSLFSSLVRHQRSDFTGTADQWEVVKASAQFVIAGAGGETVYGSSMEIEDAVSCAANKEPYGDVQYADPGYQEDKKKRYPINTAEHIRAAWSYINQEKNHKGYTSGQVSKIKSRIVSAWKKKIDPKGPPSAAK